MKKRKQRISQKEKKKPSKSAVKKSQGKKKRKPEGKQTKLSTPSKAGKQRKSVKRRQPKRKQRKKKKSELVKELVIAMTVTALLFGLLFGFTVRTPKIEGYSMTPTINDQDRLFVYKWGAVRRFTLIYFEAPETGEPMIRRIVGLPGEELYYENGSLFINGEEVPERFLSAAYSDVTGEPLTSDFTLKEMTETVRIPDDCYFVLGDNRLYATDSRYFGFVKKSDVIGTVKARIFPIHAMRQF